MTNSTPRVIAFRQRKLEQGLTRLDIWAKPEDHEKIKRFVDGLNSQSETNRKPTETESVID